MSDSGTTSALFLQGAGQTIHVGDNVGIIQTGVDTYKFNLMANAFDMTDYQKKELTSTIEGHTTVEGALGALSTNKQPKTLDTPITVDGVQKTTVESALSALVSKKMYYSIVTANDPTTIETNFKTLMPQGVNLVFWQKGGSHEVLIVQNTDADYYSYVWFSYGQPLYQRIHTPLGWSTAFNSRDAYSTNETLTNKVWNGKPIYRKVVDIGALPNATLKTIAHGITNIDMITDYYGMVASTSKTALKIPYVATESLDYIAMYVSVTNVAVKTKQDMSAYGGYAVIEYTKTT
jgi:hypothetical protein